MTKYKYVRCPAAAVPDRIRFDVPRRNQGQIVEVAYGTSGRGEADRGDPFMRVVDLSDGLPPDYYRLEVLRG
jgi:hypothetical protein